MGIDQEFYVNPDRISSSLICPICTGVVENPVITPTQHLFCESCLIEWLTKSTTCPMTNCEIAPETITTPGRLILNILAELLRKCSYQGCDWQGHSEDFPCHAKTCPCRPKSLILEELEEVLECNHDLHSRINVLEKRCLDFEDIKMDLEHKVLLMERKLKIFDAFFEGTDSPGIRSMNKRNSGRIEDSETIRMNLNLFRAGIRTPGTGPGVAAVAGWADHLRIPESERYTHLKEEDGEATPIVRTPTRSDSFLHRLLREKYGSSAGEGVAEVVKSEKSKCCDDGESVGGERDENGLDSSVKSKNDAKPDTVPPLGKYGRLTRESSGDVKISEAAAKTGESDSGKTGADARMSKRAFA